ncbi:hypothetical protein Aperf_G00000034585 [Anoplocephala perfoliata]
MSDLLSSASDILLRAIALEQDGKLTQSLVCFEEGIELLLECLKSTTDTKLKATVRERVESYISHAEKVKRSIEEARKDRKLHDHIDISNDETGYGYRRLFKRFLEDGDVTCVSVDDPYIRNATQIANFSHFCEVILTSPSPVKQINLQTGADTGKPEEQLRKFEILKRDLERHKVKLSWSFSPTLHDRQIRFNNGWVVKIGRGLEYIKSNPNNNVGLGVHDFDFRPCRQTTVDIFYEGAPPI